METVKGCGDLKVFLDSNEIIEKLKPFLKSMLHDLKDELVYPEVYLKRKEVAKLLGVSLPTVDKLTKDGTLTLRKMPGTTLGRYLQSEISNAFEQRKFKTGI